VVGSDSHEILVPQNKLTYPSGSAGSTFTNQFIQVMCCKINWHPEVLYLVELLPSHADWPLGFP